MILNYWLNKLQIVIDLDLWFILLSKTSIVQFLEINGNSH